MEYIARRYFEGCSPLFPQAAECAASLVEYAEQTVELHNDWLRERGPVGAQPIACAELKRRAVEGAMALVERTVRLSKAETLVVLGERRAAVDLIQQHL